MPGDLLPLAPVLAPADEMVLQVAVESGAEAIVTHNGRDFEGVEKAFGVRVETPRVSHAPRRGGRNVMSTLSLRLPDSLHERARARSQDAKVRRSTS